MSMQRRSFLNEIGGVIDPEDKRKRNREGIYFVFEREPGKWRRAILSSGTSTRM